MRWHTIGWVLGVGISLSCGLATGVEERGDAAPTSYRGPYCGLMCVYAYARHEHLEVDFQGLLKPEFISASTGSTLAELQTAAASIGLNAQPFGNMNLDSLKSPCAFILHTKKRLDGTEYDHFILLLEVSGDSAVIVDPPASPRRIPLHELAWIWDGNALAISSHPIDARQISLLGKMRFAWAFALLLACAIATHALSRFIRRKGWGAYKAQVAFEFGALFLLASVVAVVFHRSFSEGYSSNPLGVRAVQSSYLEQFLPKVDPNQAKALLDGGAMAIDARYLQDYRSGHLPGAINVPVNMGQDERSKALSALSRTRNLIVYCQSAKCSYAGKIAKHLAEDGFENITLLTGGWQDWKETLNREGNSG